MNEDRKRKWEVKKEKFAEMKGKETKMLQRLL
jgi:hypothetical protein